MSPNIVLGIDPGYDRCGFGVIVGSGMDWQALNHGVISTDSGLPFEMRLKELSKDLEGLLDEFNPGLMVIEELFFAKSTTNALKVAEARGVIRLSAAKRGLEVIEVKPNEVKLAIAGYGRAEKREVQEMITRTLNLKAIPKPDDAADALAVALTGAMRGRWANG
jgi:crossover junction endodeoxyribonuclease RuvC